MRPKKIEMCGFGPYLKQTIVDFEKIGQDGVFLICGDTGAGKTTIFTAMCYALYGDVVSDDKRTVESLRSDYAGLDDPSYVYFDFEHKGRNYHIERIPPYTRRSAKNPNKTIEQKHEAVFSCLETKESISGPNLVNKRVEELIGLDKKQFTQTVMICQGDFMKIIKADNSERQKLLQKVFKTKVYAQIQEKLKQMNSQCNEKLKTQKLKIEAQMKQITIEQDFTAAKEMQDYLENPDYIDSLLPLLADLLDQQNQKQEALQKQYNQLDKQHIQLVKQLEAAKGINEDFASLTKQQERKESLQKQQSEISLKQQKLQKGKNAQEVAIAQTNYDNALKNWLNTRKEVEQLTAQIKKLKEEAVALENDYIYWQKESEKLDGLKAQQQANSDALKILQQLEAEKKEYEDSLKKSEKAYLNYQKEASVHQQAVESYAKSKYGLYAQQLKEGEKCPVCGSTHHPEPAVVFDSSISDKYLDECSENEDKAKQKWDDARSQNRVLETKIGMLRNNLEDKHIAEDSSISELKNIIKQIKDTISEIENNNKQANARHQNQTKTIEVKSEQLKADQAQLVINEKTRQEALLTYNSQLAAAGFETEEAYQASKLSPGEIRQLETEINQYQMQVNNNQVLIDQLLAKVEGKQPVDLSSIEKQIDEVASERQKANDDYLHYHQGVTNNTKIKNDLEKLNEDLEKIRSEAAAVTKVYETVSGNEKSKAKLTFETYVQQHYFDQVIIAANRRLNVLSQGMFVLRRQLTASDNRSQTGLDLEVLDRNTGQWRSVNTLSGGESFLASMALALGLSDIVQAQSGEIRIDAMFIDEGFGSLDDETLRNATALLKELADGKRLIGVISHVGDLQRSIDKQIIVHKTVAGSYLEMKI